MKPLVCAVLVALCVPATALATVPVLSDGGSGPVRHKHHVQRPAPPLTMAAAYKAAGRLPHTIFNLRCYRHLGPRRVECFYSYPETGNIDGAISRTGRVCQNDVVIWLPKGWRTPMVSSRLGVVCEYGTWLAAG